MSALTPKADIDRRHSNVRFVPIADISSRSPLTSWLSMSGNAGSVHRKLTNADPVMGLNLFATILQS